MANTEFQFPDQLEKPATAEAAVEETEVEVKDDTEVGVVDDTPPQDRGRRPLGKTADEVAPDEEVEEYSAGVKKRIAELKHTYHDQRRLRETAEREREEAIRLARAVHEENLRLRATVSEREKQGNEVFKSAAEAELATAQKALKAAYESGDSDAVVAATEAMSEAKLKLKEAASFRPAPLQTLEPAVQTEAAAFRADDRALRWKQDNSWFGQDGEMTAFSLAVHQNLVKSGVDPRAAPDVYYERLNARIREKFPEAFEDDSDKSEVTPAETPRRTPPATVVAPASRNTAPKKVFLTKSQEAIAHTLGIPLKEYARQLQLTEKGTANG